MSGPELIPTYERLYAGRAYLPEGEVEPVAVASASWLAEFEVADRRVLRIAVLAPEMPPAVEQLELILSTDAEAIAKHAA